MKISELNQRSINETEGRIVLFEHDENDRITNRLQVEELLVNFGEWLLSERGLDPAVTHADIENYFESVREMSSQTHGIDVK